MLEAIGKLTVLFFVIFDPFMSYAVFYTSTQDMEVGERVKTATLAIGVAAVLSFLVVLFGARLLEIFNTNIADFKVACGIILGILGAKMAFGQSLTAAGPVEKKSVRAIGSIIGSPLLTGPAAITAIIVSVDEHGMIATSVAIAIVLFITALLFFEATRMKRLMGKEVIQVMSTVLGLITLSWGVMFVRAGFIQGRLS